jgi:integrase
LLIGDDVDHTGGLLYLKVERGIQESTINTRLSAIGAAFSFAVTQGYMNELGRPRLPRYKMPKRKPAFWTKEEFLQVLAAAREYGLRSPRTYKGDEIEAALRIGYLSGLRPGEVLGAARERR